YTLLIKMEDGNIANAVCVVPDKDIDYNSIQFIEQKPLNEFWNQIKMKAYILRWDDPNPEKRNYYALHYTSVIRNKNTGKIENNNGFYPSNVYGIEEGGSGKVITNVLQDFVLKSDYFGGKEVLNSIHCLNTDIHFYKYHKNLLALPLDPTPFEEPKDFYSNFNGNIKGTFGAYTNTSFYK
ncbi:MAG: hypothetical protein KA313_08985, partial [Pseudarcicella sp.]|nr:hypothetical protein [Pseudarcicella sp.]